MAKNKSGRFLRLSLANRLSRSALIYIGTIAVLLALLFQVFISDIQNADRIQYVRGIYDSARELAIDGFPDEVNAEALDGFREAAGSAFSDEEFTERVALVMLAATGNGEGAGISLRRAVTETTARSQWGDMGVLSNQYGAMINFIIAMKNGSNDGMELAVERFVSYPGTPDSSRILMVGAFSQASSEEWNSDSIPDELILMMDQVSLQMEVLFLQERYNSELMLRVVAGGVAIAVLLALYLMRRALKNMTDRLQNIAEVANSFANRSIPIWMEASSKGARFPQSEALPVHDFHDDDISEVARAVNGVQLAIREQLFGLRQPDHRVPDIAQSSSNDIVEEWLPIDVLLNNVVEYVGISDRTRIYAMDPVRVATKHADSFSVILWESIRTFAPLATITSRIEIRGKRDGDGFRMMVSHDALKVVDNALDMMRDAMSNPGLFADREGIPPSIIEIARAAQLSGVNCSAVRTQEGGVGIVLLFPPESVSFENSTQNTTTGTSPSQQVAAPMSIRLEGFSAPENNG